jgi:hypothetical protein
MVKNTLGKNRDLPKMNRIEMKVHKKMRPRVKKTDTGFLLSPAKINEEDFKVISGIYNSRGSKTQNLSTISKDDLKTIENIYASRPLTRPLTSSWSETTLGNELLDELSGTNIPKIKRPDFGSHLARKYAYVDLLSGHKTITAIFNGSSLTGATSLAHNNGPRNVMNEDTNPRKSNFNFGSPLNNRTVPPNYAAIMEPQMSNIPYLSQSAYQPFTKDMIDEERFRGFMNSTSSLSGVEQKLEHVSAVHEAVFNSRKNSTKVAKAPKEKVRRHFTIQELRELDKKKSKHGQYSKSVRAQNRSNRTSPSTPEMGLPYVSPTYPLYIPIASTPQNQYEEYYNSLHPNPTPYYPDPYYDLPGYSPLGLTGPMPMVGINHAPSSNIIGLNNASVDDAVVKQIQGVQIFTPQSNNRILTESPIITTQQPSQPMIHKISYDTPTDNTIQNSGAGVQVFAPRRNHPGLNGSPVLPKSKSVELSKIPFIPIDETCSGPGVLVFAPKPSQKIESVIIQGYPFVQVTSPEIPYNSIDSCSDTGIRVFCSRPSSQASSLK